MHHVTINQKNQKKGRQKEGNLPPRKLSPKKCLQKNKKQKNSPSTSKRTGSNNITQVPPKEQEATNFPRLGVWRWKFDAGCDRITECVILIACSVKPCNCNCTLDATKFPHIHLSPSIHSRLVGSAGPMLPPTKKTVRLWIGSPWAMAAANTATRLAAATCHL